MNKPAICDQCGAPIPENSVDGQCPACLLKRGLGEFESAATQPEQLAPTVVPADDATAHLHGELRPDQQFGDYRIVRRLGSGGMGTVYEADHVTTGRRVALKVLSHSLNREARTRFLREGRLAAAINHPNSVYVFGTEEIEDVPTISMELVSGGTLASQVQKFGAMPVAEAVDTMLQVIDGLEAAERKGVLHRDIKPSNCFVDAQGGVKVGDFGLSISTMPTDVTVATMTQEGSFLGTPAFASPEQLRGEQLDQRSDIYSVGATLYYLLTGRTPFEGKSLVQLLANVLDKQAPLVHESRDDIPEGLSKVVQACLAKASGSRPTSYAELRQSLLPFSSQLTELASPVQRLVAGGIDYLLVRVLCGLVGLAGFALGLLDGFTESWWPFGITNSLTLLAYFVVSEAGWGQTVGKYLLGVKVIGDEKTPSLREILTRAFPYMVLFQFGDFLGLFLVNHLDDIGNFLQVNLSWLRLPVQYVGYAPLLWLFWPPIRGKSLIARHDAWSKTQVVQVQSEPVADCYPEIESIQPADKTQTIGPYHVLETVCGEADESLFLAFDPELLRRVWLRMHPDGTPELSSVDKNLSRVTRLRWLGSHREPGQNWDCYEAPVGHSLCDHASDWEFDRRLISKLTDELSLAMEDGSVPETLSVDRLWIGGDQLKLLPFEVNPKTDTRALHTGSTAEEQQQACARFVSTFAEALTAETPDSEVSFVPLRAQEPLFALQGCDSFARTKQYAGELSKGLASVSRGRRRVFLFATFAIPLVLSIGTLVWQVSMIAAYHRHPEVSQVSWVMQQIRDSSIAANMVSGPGAPALREQVQEPPDPWKIYLAGAYRETYENPRIRNSMWARLAWDGAVEARLKEIMDSLNPTESELAAAREELQEFVVSNRHGIYRNPPGWRYRAVGPFHEGNTGDRNRQLSIDELVAEKSGYYQPHFDPSWFMQHLLVWQLVVWLPGLFASLVDGGLLQRAIGVGFANSSGKPASKARAFCRALLPGFPILIGIGVVAGRSNIGTTTRPEWASGFGVLLLVLLAATAMRKRFLSDSLAGTRLVPR